jgi:uncharacterized membrane protein
MVTRLPRERSARTDDDRPTIRGLRDPPRVVTAPSVQADGMDAEASRPQPPARPRLHAAAERVGDLSAVDGVAAGVGRAIRSAVQPGPLRDTLSGRAVGHALHPLLTDVPVGAWTSATMLDALGGDDGDRSAQRLIAIGIAAALPTAASGLLDWADTEPADAEVRRVGVVHAASNVTALALYAASLAVQRRGAQARARLLRLAGAGAMAVGGHLGGHLSYGKAVRRRRHGAGIDARRVDRRRRGGRAARR